MLLSLIRSSLSLLMMQHVVWPSYANSQCLNSVDCVGSRAGTSVVERMLAAMGVPAYPSTAGSRIRAKGMVVGGPDQNVLNRVFQGHRAVVRKVQRRRHVQRIVLGVPGETPLDR